MRPEVKSLLWVVPIAAAVAAGIIYFTLQTPPAQIDMAPDFAVKTLDGRTVSLKSLRGKPLFLNFWSSW